MSKDCTFYLSLLAQLNDWHGSSPTLLPMVIMSKPTHTQTGTQGQRDWFPPSSVSFLFSLFSLGNFLYTITLHSMKRKHASSFIHHHLPPPPPAALLARALRPPPSSLLVLCLFSKYSCTMRRTTILGKKIGSMGMPVTGERRGWPSVRKVWWKKDTDVK